MLTLPQLQTTYCNPLPLPDYPRGRCANADEKTRDAGYNGWMRPERRDFRETADPSVLYHDGRWYLYPSAGMAWVTEDFVRWEHHRIEPYDAGYAPTILKHDGRFYLTACHAPLYVANHPLGPFEPVGPMLLPDGKPIPYWADPMLFADDDGQVYAYWGLGGPGIYGARLEPEQLNRLATDPAILFGYNPDHLWERFGDFNEDATQSYVEGAWMFKERGTYYLTYAAPGTQFRTYGMGVYVSDRPLGPFRYAARNPISLDREGFVHGPGHGCIVRGPNDTLWAFYTCLVRNEFDFERRVGMDPAGIDADGNLFTLCASETPQWAPGVRPHPENGNDTGLLPVTVNKYASASSTLAGREPAYAIDNNPRTWWQADPADAQPELTVQLRAEFTMGAVRLCWKEPGLDYDAGVLPGPMRYVVEVDRGEGDWVVAVDASRNDADLLIDYRVFKPVQGRAVRLRVLGWPEGMGVGVIDFCVFGGSEPKRTAQ